MSKIQAIASELEFVIAGLRRIYLHIEAGGDVTADDIHRRITGLESVYRKLVDLANNDA